MTDATTGLTPGRPTSGTNPWIDSLVWGGRWDDPTPAGGRVQLGYTLMSGADPNNANGIWNAKGWDGTEAAAIARAMAAWEAVAKVDFVQTSSGNADLWYWLGDNFDLGSTTLGWHEVPYGSVQEPLYGAFNYQGYGWTGGGLASGGLVFNTLLHELGHGLGLAHPHDGGTAPDGTVFPGVTADFGSYGQYGLNQGIWTVMSYNDGWTGRPTVSDVYGHAATPMALDIAAIQAIYGAAAYATGSNTYTLPKANGGGAFWSCIWDTGGADAISAVGATVGAVIHLGAAPLVGPNAAGFISSVAGIVGGFTIANGVVIENALGGNAGDTITGNAFANLLYGFSGNDRLYGGNGDDRLDGGTGNDVLNGGNGIDTLFVGGVVGVTINLSLTGWQSTGGGLENITLIENVTGGSAVDVLRGNAGVNDLRGGSGNDRLHGGAGNDVMLGQAGNDLVYGEGGNDVLHADAGNDRLDGGSGIDTVVVLGATSVTLTLAALAAQATGIGVDTIVNVENIVSGAGNDRLTGSALSNVLKSGAGNDIVNAGLGDDFVWGGTGNDILNGEDGNDALYGEDGNDRFLDSAGDDLMTGGLGADRFVFNMGGGTNQVTDFDNGFDKIEIASGALDMSEVVITDAGANVTVSFADVIVTLQNIDHLLIDAGDFLFT